MATYKVESVQTGYYIISNGEERHGNVVSSYNSNQGVPSDTVRALRRLSFAIVDDISYPTRT